MAEGARRPFPWAAYAVVFAVIAVLALLPVASVFLAYTIAEPNGCRVDEAGIYPCVIAGVDFGPLLAYMAVSGWLMLASIPFGVMALVVWAVVLVVHLVWRRRAIGSAS